MDICSLQDLDEFELSRDQTMKLTLLQSTADEEHIISGKPIWCISYVLEVYILIFYIQISTITMC